MTGNCRAVVYAVGLTPRLNCVFTLPEGTSSPWHEAFFCTECGQIWARVYTDREEVLGWFVQEVTCINCLDELELSSFPKNPSGYWAGSIVSVYGRAEEVYPIEILKREIMVWRPSLELILSLSPPLQEKLLQAFPELRHSFLERQDPGRPQP